MQSNIEISVIAPVLNEEKNITEFYQRVSVVLKKMQLTYEIILVDDGSKDATLNIIEALSKEDSNLKYISFSRNFGHQNAMAAGIENAIGKAVVLIDSDLQDPPEVIEELYNKLQTGYNVVYAKRNNRKGETILKKATASFFYRIMSKITTVNIPVDTGDFRIIDRAVCNELIKMKEYNKFLRGQIAWLGFKESFVAYDRDERKFGRTNFTYKKMLGFAFDGITGFSNFPLKFASLTGIVFSFAAFIFIVYILLAKFIWGQTITGWASIMVTILFLGGIQLLSIGIIGEYMSRINDNVRNRQNYIVSKSNIDKEN